MLRRMSLLIMDPAWDLNASSLLVADVSTRPQFQDLRTSEPGLVPASVRAHEVLLADLHAIVAQEVVRRGDMEEELRQSVRQQVGLAANAAFLRRAGTQHDLALRAAFESLRLQATDEGQRRRYPLLQVGERLVAALVGRDLRAREPRRHAGGEIA